MILIRMLKVVKNNTGIVARKYDRFLGAILNRQLLLERMRMACELFLLCS
jgi:hypothetical protein